MILFGINGGMITMARQEERWKNFFIGVKCNKCKGKVMVEMSKDKYNDVSIDKAYCIECGREFLQFSYNPDYLLCDDINVVKIKDLDRTRFIWDKWIDPNER